MSGMRFLIPILSGIYLGFTACGVKGPPVPYVEVYPETTAPEVSPTAVVPTPPAPTPTGAAPGRKK